MGDSVRLAIVGVGWAGLRHSQAVAELRTVGEPVVVDCFVEPDKERLAEIAAEHDVTKSYTSLDDALSDPNVDAVDIATPHALHEPMTIQSLEAGKHVIVEKPMAMNVDEASRMVAAAEANGMKLFVGENHSYEPYIEFLREVVTSGTPIGDVTTASVVTGFRPKGRYEYAGRRAWLAEPELGGTGTWMLHGIHTMAGVRRVFGEVARIYVQEHKTESFERRDMEGTMSALLTMDSGLNVSVVQSPETRFRGNSGGYLIHGELGSVRATASNYEIIAEDEDEAPRPYPKSSLSSYALEFKAFADYIGGDKSVATTGYSERRTLAVIQAGIESVALGRVIDVRERFGAL